MIPKQESNDLRILAQRYNMGQLDQLGISRFSLPAGTCNSYPTSKSALIFPVSGQAYFQFDDLRLIAHRGLLLHGCPGKMLSIHVNGEQTFQYINIYYNMEGDLLFSIPLKKAGTYIQQLEQILELRQSVQLRDKYRADRMTDELFLRLFSEVQDKDEYSEREILATLTDYIHVHYAEPITLGQLASIVNEKPQRVSYLFFKYTGVRPIDYLIDYRLKCAVQQLTAGGCTVTEAAKSVGYTDACYFCRLFKKRLGFPPGQIKN